MSPASGCPGEGTAQVGRVFSAHLVCGAVVAVGFVAVAARQAAVVAAAAVAGAAFVVAAVVAGAPVGC